MKSKIIYDCEITSELIGFYHATLFYLVTYTCIEAVKDIYLQGRTGLK